MQPLKLFFDGGAAASGTEISYGFVLKDHKDGVIAEIGRKLICKGTSNQAEYLGLILGLTYCLAKRHYRIKIYGDSQLVIRQMKREYKTNEEKLVLLNTIAQTLMETFEEYSFEWIPREENHEADRQTR